MRPAFALFALVFAVSLGREALADDVIPPP